MIMSNLWNQFDKTFDVEGLKHDAAEAKENGGNFKEVPVGDYEVKIEKLELGETKDHKPAVDCWFKILEGEYKGSMLFMKQVISSGFGLHKANEFLRSLETEMAVEFESFSQYGEMIMDIAEYIEEHKMEYAVKFTKNKQGYNNYEITDVFEN